MATEQTLDASAFGRILPAMPAADGRIDQHEQRQRVLLGTIRAFEENDTIQKYHRIATSNLERWHQQSRVGDRSGTCKVIVSSSDWGEMTSQLTKEYGTMFAVLNMASAHVPGGGYTEGCPAQEENMFRRTDCHFSIRRDDRQNVVLSNDPFDADLLYSPQMSRLLQGKDGKVYLDMDNPRVCTRGPEEKDRVDLGYHFLPKDEIFPFYELRAAAVDLRGGKRFNEDEMRRRIRAQLDTLVEAGVRHAVLSAFGCGAYQNPSREVAAIYREEMELRQNWFEVVAFAIFDAGYGPDNFTSFQNAFDGFGGAISSTSRSIEDAPNAQSRDSSSSSLSSPLFPSTPSTPAARKRLKKNPVVDEAFTTP